MSRDPYAIVRDELLKEMRSVNQSYANWKDMCQNGSAPQINAAVAEVKEHIAEADELLEEMQKANDIAERDITKFGFDQDEMNARKSFVSNYKKKIRDIQADLAVPFDRARNGAASGPTKAQRYQDAINRDNENFMNQQEQTQEELFARHDAQFDTLHDGIRSIGEVARVMGEEAKAQNELLDSMNDEAGQAEDEIRSATRKVEKLIERMQGNCGWVCIGILVAILALVSFLAMAI